MQVEIPDFVVGVLMRLGFFKVAEPVAVSEALQSLVADEMDRVGLVLKRSAASAVAAAAPEAPQAPEETQPAPNPDPAMKEIAGKRKAPASARAPVESETIAIAKAAKLAAKLAD